MDRTGPRVALPAYHELPIDPTYPPGSAWGVFGSEDEVGTINLLTPECVLRGVNLVRKGSVFSLNWDLEKPNPPILGRGALRHTITNLAEIEHPGTDDCYDNFYPQASSQWDSLSHIAHPEHQYYNGRTVDEFTGKPGSRNGIDNWGRRGIVGRFVLADVEAYRRQRNVTLDPSEKVPITVDEIEATLEHQGSRLETGDILMIRFGWIAWYDSTDFGTRKGLAKQMLSSPGLVAEEQTAEWLWDQHVAAVVADCPALEATPFDVTTVDGFLHYRIIPLLGLAVGEMFYLDELARDCADDGVYEGLFTAAPLNKVGGSGSPANALALK
jgi:kynurenine formamidase